MKFADQTGITELITLTKTALKPLEAFKNSVTDVNGIVKSNGSGGFSAAVAGADYAAATHTHTTKQIEGLSSAIAKAEPFVVEMTTGSGDVTINKSFSEIKAAFDAGRICYARESKHGIILSLVGFFSYGGVIKATFVISSLSNVTVTPHAAIEALFVAEDNSINTRSVTLQPQIKATGLLKGSGDGNITAAVAGTDYAAASHTHTTSQVEGLSDAIAKAEPFVVTIQITTSSGGGKTYTADKTYSEIKAAIDAGKCCYAITTGLEMNILFPALVSSVGVLFIATQPDSASSVVMAILSDSSIIVQTYSTQPLIEATGLLKGDGQGTISAAVAGTDYLSPNGGTLTGPLVAQTNTSYTTAQMRNVIISTADPSGGNNGDIWLKYEA